MKLRRPFAVALAAVATACGGGPTEPEVMSVSVSPGASTLTVVGATVQLSAQAKDANGTTVSGVTVTWTSSETAVATVSATGLVTAVASGTSTITATAEGASGSATITVSPQAVACDEPTPVALAPGEAAFFSSNECFLLPSGTAGDRYRVVVTRPDSAGASSVTETTLSITGVGVAAAAPSAGIRAPAQVAAPPVRGLDDRTLREAARVAEATESFHHDLRAREVGLLNELRAGSVRLAPTGPAAPALRAAAVAAPEKIRIDTSTPSMCSQGAGAQATGILVHESDDLVIYQDSTQRVNAPISVGQAQRMTSYYAAYARDMMRSYFGAFSDVDGNGKVVVFASPVVSGNVAAFVWSGDFLASETCPASNQMELIFFNSEVIRAMDRADNPNYQALETLAHEAKHVSSLYRRLQASQSAQASRFHPSWIEEGTAEIAGEMSSRIAWAATGGPPVGARVTRSDLGSPIRVSPENYGVLLRMVRTVWYLNSQPNGLVVSPSGAKTGHSIYGSGWNFHRWVGDAYGGGAANQADAALFRALNDSLAGQGTVGLRQVTGRTFRELFREYVVAVSLHGNETTEGPLPYTGYDFLTATDILCRQGQSNCTTPQPDGTYPWPVTTTTSGPSRSFATGSIGGPVGPTGMRIHDLVSDGTGTGARIQVSMNMPGEIVVVRLR